jgi:hypothetical protein
MTFEHGNKVTYHGVTRPQLGDLNGTLIQKSLTRDAWLVEFRNSNGILISKEWVAASALKLAPSGPLADALASLKDKLEEHEKKVAEAENTLESLRKEEDQLHRAIDALRQVA